MSASGCQREDLLCVTYRTLRHVFLTGVATAIVFAALTGLAEAFTCASASGSGLSWASAWTSCNDTTMMADRSWLGGRAQRVQGGEAAGFCCAQEAGAHVGADEERGIRYHVQGGGQAEITSPLLRSSMSASTTSVPTSTRYRLTNALVSRK